MNINFATLNIASSYQNKTKAEQAYIVLPTFYSTPSHMDGLINHHLKGQREKESPEERSYMPQTPSPKTLSTLSRIQKLLLWTSLGRFVRVTTAIKLVWLTGVTGQTFPVQYSIIGF